MAIKAGDGVQRESAESAGSASRASSGLWPLGPVTLVVAAAVLGLVVGGVTQVLQAHLDSPWLSLVNAASPWLFFAFAIGAAGRTRGLGPALLGGYFLAEAADYQWNLHYHSTALLFAVIGV